MHFESFRDGMEDLELLYLLMQLNPESAALNVSLVKDIDDYNESIEQYLEFRSNLLSEITRTQQ